MGVCASQSQLGSEVSFALFTLSACQTSNAPNDNLCFGWGLVGQCVSHCYSTLSFRSSLYTKRVWILQLSHQWPTVSFNQWLLALCREWGRAGILWCSLQCVCHQSKRSDSPFKPQSQSGTISPSLGDVAFKILFLCSSSGSGPRIYSSRSLLQTLVPGTPVDTQIWGRSDPLYKMS